VAYNLFLDDIRSLGETYKYTKDQDYLEKKWIIVRSYDDFVRVVEEEWGKGNFPEVISFDHDLAPEHYAPREHWDDHYGAWAHAQEFIEKTGYEAAKFYVDFRREHDLPMAKIKCHSMNPVGKKKIIELFK
jgi:ASC-1-like (ASCH) protein